MAALLPLAVLILLAIAFRRRAPDAAAGRREALLSAAVATGLAAVASTEILGALRVLTRASVVGFWLVSAVFAALAARRAGAGRTGPRPAAKALAPGDRFLVAAAAVPAILVLVTAVVAAPNNWDSLTYHLPRVAHWIQDRGVQSYPTAILRQLTLPPGAEFLLTHLGLLSGGDRLFPLLQWGAWIGCLIAASSAAAWLGAGRVGQLAAAVFAATLPLAILQASGTQNDLVAAFWMFVFADRSLRIAAAPPTRLDLLAAGGSLGLALLTKATAYPFVLPFAVVLAIALLRRERVRAAAPLLAVAALALAVNAGYFARNESLFGSPFGRDYGALNEIHTPAALVSNLSRNALLHFALPSAAWNGALERGVASLHRGLGLDPSDPRTTWKGAEFHVPPGLRGAARPDPDEIVYLALHEDQAGNPIHFLLIAAAAVAGALAWRRRPLAALSLGAVATGAVLFSFLLKWQPWNTRLQLPLFLLAAPAVAALLTGDDAPGRTRLAAALLLGLSLPWVFLNATRPLVGPESVWTVPRLDQFFAARPSLEEPLRSAAAAVASMRCDRVAIAIGPDDPEYLLWVTLGQAILRPRIEHSAGSDATRAQARRPEFATFRPCALLSLEPSGSLAPQGAVFTREWEGGRVSVRPVAASERSGAEGRPE